MISLDVTRAAWNRAAKFPPNKEHVYFEHGQAQQFDRIRDKRVFEYGCGGGSDTMSYLRRGNTVFYADVVPENVIAATQRISQAGLAKRAYGITLEASWPIPLAGNVFDVVNSHGVLHHIEDPRPVILEFHRLLNRDGKLYVMLYTEMLWDRFKTQRDLLVSLKRCATQEEAFCWCTDGENTPYARAYTESEGIVLLRECGFVVEATTLYNNNDFRTFVAHKDVIPEAVRSALASNN